MKKCLLLLFVLLTIHVGVFAQTSPHWLQLQGRPNWTIANFDIVDYGATPHPADSSGAITAAINAAAAHGGGRVIIPPGTWGAHGIKLQSGVSISGSGMGVTTVVFNGPDPATNATAAYILAPEKTIFYNFAVADDGHTSDPATNLAGISITDMRIDYSGYLLKETFNSIEVSGVTNFSVERVHFYGFPCDAILLDSSKSYIRERHNQNVVITDCIFDGVDFENRAAVSIIDVNGFWLARNRFHNTSGLTGTVNFEPDPFRYYSLIENICIEQNVFDVGLRLIDVSFFVSAAQPMSHTYKNITIRNNHFIGGGWGVQVRNYPTAGGDYSSTLGYWLATYDPPPLLNHIWPGGESYLTVGIQIYDNLFECNRPISLIGVQGVSVARNEFRLNDTQTGPAFGLQGAESGASYNTKFITVADNTFLASPSVSIGSLIDGTYGLRMERNTFVGAYSIGAIVGNASGAHVEALTVVDNDFSRMTSGAAMRIVQAEGVDKLKILNPSTSLISGNHIAPTSPVVSNNLFLSSGTALVASVEDLPPASFSLRFHQTYLINDASLGSGKLTTAYDNAQQSQGFTPMIQTYHSTAVASSTPTLKIRKAISGTAWSAWQTLTP
jgi:hypothetical protein